MFGWRSVAHLSFAAEALGFDRIVDVVPAEHLDGADFAGPLVGRPVDAGEGAGADQVQDLVVAVEETGPLTAQHALGLVVGQQLAAFEQLPELVAGHCRLPIEPQISCSCRSSSRFRSRRAVRSF